MSLHFHAHLLQLTETYGHVFQTPDMDLKMFTEKRVIRYKGIDRTRTERNNNKKELFLMKQIRMPGHLG